MRGELTRSVLHQLLPSHGVRATLCGPPCNATRLAHHLDRHGAAAACVGIKYPDPAVSAVCRARGALVVLDNVDSHLGFENHRLADEGSGYRTLDAMLVQTRAHAEWLAARHGLRSIVLPHPHGNLNAWSVSRGVRARVSGVGLLMGDPWRNQLPRDDAEAMTAVACGLNLTLMTMLSMPGRPVQYHPRFCPNASAAAWLLHGAWVRERRRGEAKPRWLQHHDTLSALAELRETCERGDGGGRGGGVDSGGGGSGGGVDGGGWHRGVSSDFCASSQPPDGWPAAPPWSNSSLEDATHQHGYYRTPQLHEAVDLGLLWRPGNQVGSSFAVANRPPTRMAWWWSHGVPTLGYPMAAYAEGAARAGYPAQLLNVSRVVDLPAALCALMPQRRRACLREAALRGAAVTSPQYSAHELVVSLCELASTCGVRFAGV